MQGKGVQDSFLRRFQWLTLHLLCVTSQNDTPCPLQQPALTLQWLMCLLCCMCNLDVGHGVPITGDVPGNQARHPTIMSFGVPPAGRPKPNLVPPPPPSLLGGPAAASDAPPPPQPAAAPPPPASSQSPPPLPGIASVPAKGKAQALTMQGGRGTVAVLVLGAWGTTKVKQALSRNELRRLHGQFEDESWGSKATLHPPQPGQGCRGSDSEASSRRCPQFCQFVLTPTWEEE